jgi:hypothetical protein
MSNLNRRTFLKLLGQGTAALGMGFSLSAGAACAKEESGTTAGSGSKNTKGKYQTFQPGEYLDWEKDMIEERMAIVRKGPQKTTAGAAPAPITEDEIIAANRKVDPYNPLFNDKEYARKAGYPSVPGVPGTQGARGRGGARVPPIPKDFGDQWYYHNDGGDNRIYRHVFAGDTFVSEQESIFFDELTVPGSDLRHFKLGSSSKIYDAKTGEQVGWQKGNTREAYRKIIDGSPAPSFSDNMAEWVHDFPSGHYTTDEEYEYIKELWKNEFIRGSQKLYWEDVKVGDVPTPVCSAPYSYHDIAMENGGGASGVLLRNRMDEWSTMYRDKYGIYLPDTALHYGNRNIPGSRMVFFNGTHANHLIRMVTNYIGDAGVVTRKCHRLKAFFKEMQLPGYAGRDELELVPHMKGKECTLHGGEGDTIIARGYVTKKYKNEKGEGIIDIACWAETFDPGRIVGIVGASAKLPLKKG